MSASLKTVSKIDERAKYGVYGWLREAEKELNLEYIPPLIANLCILFFGQFERFQVNNVGIGIISSKNEKCIASEVGKGHFGGWWNIFGTAQISANHDSKHKYKWELHLNTAYGGCVVGLSTMTDSQIEQLKQGNCVWDDHSGAHYLYYACAASVYCNMFDWKRECDYIKKSGTVVIYLDADKGQIRLQIDSDASDGMEDKTFAFN